MQTETYLIDLLGPYMLGMLISLAIGLMLGLEREYDKIKDEIGIAGIRTFPIATVLGFMMGSLAESFSTSFLLVGPGAPGITRRPERPVSGRTGAARWRGRPGRRSPAGRPGTGRRATCRPRTPGGG